LFGPQGAPIEVQIRTKEMDQLANNGIAAHWAYKNGAMDINNADIRTQQWVNNLLEMQQNTSSSLEFIENVKIDLFPDEVYVFTPKGDIRELPRGSTAVDLAYTIHTDIGNTCVAARIDRKFLPLSTILLNGQMVSIITSPSAKPNPSWLSFVTTGKARVNIRNYLKNKHREELIALGKQLLDKAFSDLKIDFSSIHLEAISNFLKKINLKDINDLYESIGIGNHFAIFVAHQLASIADKQTEVVQSLENKPLLIHGADGLAITFCAYCCPIPGDPIVGFLNKGRGLDIHVQDCLHLTKLRKQSENYLPVEWAEDVTGNFRVALKIGIRHKRGALAGLTGAIAEAHATIDDIFIGERNGDYCSVGLQLLVKNLFHLQRVVRYIKKLPIAIEITRKKYSQKA
jgi:guanosine-3',5'-bis(diphosphate) 3'-pyrophosphohydrolase